MPSYKTIVFSVVFVSLIVVAQLNISSFLSGLPRTLDANGSESLRSLVTQLQSELKAVELQKRRLEDQVQNMMNSTSPQQADPEILATITQLQSELKEMQQARELLELRVNSWMNWNSDPYLGSNANASICQNSTELSEYGCARGKNKCPGLYDHPVCLDHFPPPPDKECIVYDFGIRENPEFGQTLLNAPFHCKIFAFDPSPITRKWYETSPNSEHLRSHSNYTLFHYGAGGKDGMVKLNEYDWGQVSIIRFPLQLHKNCTKSNATTGNCDLDFYGGHRQGFALPVKTLDTIMKELGHDHIDILKVDVEGSEYAFLEHALEKGNLQHVDQLTVEWHHFDFDSRYGGGSTPAINAIVALLNKIGLQQFHIHDDIGGWPSTHREYWEKQITVRYNLASFVRV